MVICLQKSPVSVIYMSNKIVKNRQYSAVSDFEWTVGIKKEPRIAIKMSKKLKWIESIYAPVACTIKVLQL
jgi:hypothetical protein